LAFVSPTLSWKERSIPSFPQVTGLFELSTRKRLGVRVFLPQESRNMLSHCPRLLTALGLSILIVGFTLVTTQAQVKKVKETLSYAAPTLNLVAEPNVITVCDATNALVQLNAKASSSDSNAIRYSWRTNGGRIEGSGETVTWNLAGLAPGYYRAFIEIETGTGEELCQAFSSTTVLVNRCPPPAPVCPQVAISCPDTPGVGQPLEFSASVTGGSTDQRVYNWTVSGGTIISGQGTDRIRIDTKGLAGATIRASLSMGGLPLDCSATCEVHLPVPIEPSKFDEFPDIARNDEKARLDNYAIELHNDPTATAYVIVFPGSKGRAGEVQQHTKRVVEYMVASRGIDERRIVTKVGPARPDLMVELWICPQGCKPPSPIR
jgi:hypothetical protein